MNFTRTETSFQFKALPFLWHPLKNYQENPFPESLPFELVCDPATAIVSQKSSPEILDALNRSYKAGTYFEGLMGPTGIGAQYAEDFQKFIQDACGLKNFSGKNVLEIGCGTGFLLSNLQNLGANVTGFEPGYSSIGLYPVKVIPKLFPSEEIRGQKFDLIIAFALLEHIEHPETILQDMAKHLKESGTLILSVPDCEHHIKNGDISMLIHEHISYFTPESFKTFLESNKFKTLSLKKSSFGGSIYAAFRLDNQTIKQKNLQRENLKLFEKIKRNISSLDEYLKNKSGQSVGIYVPVRGVNALFVLKDKTKQYKINLRFFDDADYLLGKYFPGFDIAIENKEDLIRNPADNILIFSYSFGEKIAESLKGKIPVRTDVRTISELS